MRLFFLLFLSVVAATAARGADFLVRLGSEDMVEGGRIEKMTVITSNRQFNIFPPKNWSRQVNDASRKIIFTSPSGKSAVTVWFSANSPGQLPPPDQLRDQALQAHPGAGISPPLVCPTSFQPGVFFDLVRLPAPNVVQKIRHAFVPGPLGVEEFVLTSSGDEFDQNRLVFMAIARSFRVEPPKARP
jgi:hypothetical protein